MKIYEKSMKVCEASSESATQVVETSSKSPFGHLIRKPSEVAKLDVEKLPKTNQNSGK